MTGEPICWACDHKHASYETVYFLADGTYQCMDAYQCVRTQNGEKRQHD
jgi:hypothetical protein